MRSLVFLAVALLTAIIACSGSSDPCDGQGTYGGQDLCARTLAAVQTKCQGATLDCPSLLAPCKPTSQFCKPGIDASLAKINGAADCNAALAVKLESKCFD